MMLRLLSLALLLALVPAASAQQPTVGQVSFANSGAPDAQAPFLRGLALLHNFEYSAAAAAFREAQAADPGFAMAYWGEAMTYNHPVWMEQDLEAARMALARLAPTAEARRARSGSEREQLYLDAVEILYGEGDKAERDHAYSRAMEALHRRFPDDVDARAFYALSLLGLAHHGRDVPLYMRAAALLEEVYPQNPDHPGVLHYLIHSYDDPTHAPLGLRAARRYGAVAPEASHALHMTAHIFLALGMWDESVAANTAAMTALNRPRIDAGLPTFECGHAVEWLVYSEYQRGRAAAADAQVERCRAGALVELARPAEGTIEPRRSAVLSYADMAVRRLIETGEWAGAHGLELQEGRYLATRFTLAYGDLIAAAYDPTRIEDAHARLRAAAEALRVARGGSPPSAVGRREEIVLRQAAGLERMARGDVEAGLAELRAAADAERSIPAEFGPPLVEKPSHELLGDALLRLGRRDEARRAYEAALALAPGRRLSVQGAALEQSAAR